MSEYRTNATLPPHLLDRFRKIWKNLYGEDLEEGEALSRALKLLAMMRVVAQPIPPENEALYSAIESCYKEKDDSTTRDEDQH